jgi:hypothetical protein
MARKLENTNKNNLIIKKKKINIFLLEGKILNQNLIERLKNKLMFKIQNSNMHYKTNVKAKMSEYNSFNNDEDFHEFINLIIPFVKTIKDNPFVIHSSWGNIYENNTDKTVMHNHLGCDMMSGILYLTNKGPGTYFKEFNLTTKEQTGKFILFSPEADHEVKPFKYKEKRMVLSFNLDTIRNLYVKKFNNIQNI